MRIAVPCWGDRISPVFDVAQNLLLIDVDGEAETGRQSLSIAGMSPPAKLDLLKNNSVNIILCGAISNSYHQLLELSGIQVYPWNSGNVDEIIEAALQDRLLDARHRMPGCRRRRGRRRGRGQR